MKTIQWNRKAVERAREQGLSDPRDVICPGCGTKPTIRELGRYRCECGELEGFVTRN